MPIYMKEYVETWRDNLAVRGDVSFTGIYNNEIIGYGGVQPYWTGVAEGWILLTTTADKYLKTYSFQRDLLILTRTSLEKVMANFKLWRVQVGVRIDNQMAINFVKHLGFNSPVLLKKYCPDKMDAYLYSLIKGD